MDQANVYSHSRSRTTSSNVFPAQPQHPPPMHLSHQMSNQQFNRRSPSVSTFSNSSIPPPAAYRTSSNSDLRRSISNRSFGQPQATGYVALLRKQKATVWCDRAQYEDPRIVAQQRAAKMRANLEVSGGNRGSGSAGSSSGGRTSTGISATGKVAAKIRHHGKTPVVGYANENHVGVGGVPMRLSATEVEGESSEEEDNNYASRSHHRRTGSSGRSSVGSSSRRNVSYRSSGGTVTGAGTQGARRWSPGDTPERAGSLVEQPEDGTPITDDAASGRAQSTHSGSSAERADNVGELGAAPRLASKSLMHSALTREKSVKSPEELKRRGSVDERTATLTSQRLYIANPD
ncbi:hypothetical protein TARUN_5460 [Trichoderma arundinaceum]|uniref:Uncharacterized protein n=1 Tax=Trichoderma arundinaceum TaxID=490622 RepID=A0A395NLE0_TRIAR|nr:hypothetical protein TARUN_5460 [Trichoderma arundinaceum]